MPWWAWVLVLYPVFVLPLGIAVGKWIKWSQRGA